MQNFDNKELQKLVSEVLYYQWDPIGVSESPGTRNEYEEYVPQVLAILQRGNTPQELAAFLSGIRCRGMGLEPDPDSDQNTSERLYRHKQAILDGLA
jgi:hypothetical protein